MKSWQAITLLLLFAAGELFVLLHEFSPQPVLITQAPTATPTPDDSPVTLLFVGDVMLSRSVGDMMARTGDWRWPFQRIVSVTAGADLAFANLETSVSTRGTPQGCGYCFRTDPRALDGLVFAGFDVLSVANNHAHDYGPEAFADTVAYVKASGISPVGNDGLVIRTVRGTRIAFLAYTYPLGHARIIGDIAQARPMTDVLVVSLHGGNEYEPVHSAEQERIYRAAVDAGADLVIGTHPHVVQELVRYRQGWIAYSLGNFVFDQNFSSATMQGMLLTATVDDGRISDVASRSVSISRQYQPFLP